jgi:hypothetical protein
MLGLLLCLVGCGGGSADDGVLPVDPAPDEPIPNDPPAADPEPYRPPPLATWHWQLQGEVNTGYAVDVYGIDLFDSPSTLIADLQAAGRRVICYFSAGSFEDWRPDAAVFPDAVLGNPLDGWPGERWLDVRAASVREVMQARLDLAQAKGCDGVDPDNVDAYMQDTGFPLTADDQLDYNRFLAREAHARDLAVGLKNDLEQIPQLVADFDFAVNESCHVYDECDLLAPFVAAGKAVFNAEYAAVYVDDPAARAALCASALAAGLSTLVLPVELDGSFRFACH